MLQKEYEADAGGLAKKKQRGGRVEELEEKLIKWYRWMDSQHGIKMVVTDDLLLQKAKEIGASIKLELDENKFNYSLMWLHKFKRRFNIGTVILHGEAGSADMDNVKAVRRDIPRLLADVEPHRIYNCDETGLFYRQLPRRTMIDLSNKKGKRGAKLAKDRLTLLVFSNATGRDTWKPVIIGTAKKPRCFGTVWTPALEGALYYDNKTAWMNIIVWIDIMHKFDMYCYDISSAGKHPVYLLTDNAPSHATPPNSSPWSMLCGDVKYSGYKMRNVVVVFLLPNCTSMVQPADAGLIMSFKALFRKRQLAWLLCQLEKRSETKEERIVPNVREAIEWSCASLRELKSETIVNCWKRCEILPISTVLDLENTGVRHNNRAEFSEKCKVSADIMDDLSRMLGALATTCASTASPTDEAPSVPGASCADFLTAEELLGLPIEAETEQPEEPQLNQETDAPILDECSNIDATYGVDENASIVDDELPPPTLSLVEAQQYAEALFKFVQEHMHDMKPGGVERNYNSYVAMMDTLRYKLQRMVIIPQNKQSSLRSFFGVVPNSDSGGDTPEIVEPMEL